MVNRLIDKIKTLDFFELGNSVLVYWFFIFVFLPIISMSGLPDKITIFRNVERNAILDLRAIFYLALGAAFFILGYRLSSKKKFFSRLPRIIHSQWIYNSTVKVFALLFIVASIIKYIVFANGIYFHFNKNLSFVQGPFYSLIGLLEWLGIAALALAFIYYFYLFKNHDPRYKVWQVIAWSDFVLEFIYGFMSGGRFDAIVPILIYLIVRHYIYERGYKRVVIAAFLILFVLMPVQSFYNSTPVFLYAYVGPAGGNQGKISAVSNFIFDNSFRRLDQSRIIGAVFNNTDKFLYGKTLFNFFISLGPPRFLWKDKPIINAGGNEFGRKYGILPADDFKTSVGPTVIGDWYLNFGVFGITIGMFFVGILFSLVYSYLVSIAEPSPSGIMIYSIFWTQLIKGMEDWVAPVWAGLLKLFVILLMIHLLLSREKFNKEA